MGRSKYASTTFPLDGDVGVSPGIAPPNINADVREMADMVPHQMWFADPQGSIEYINHRFYEYTGLDRSMATSLGWISVVHPDDLDECFRIRNEAIAEVKPWRFDYRVRRHDGEYRWHVGRTLPLFDENGVLRRWVGTATDIHEEVMAARKQRKFIREVLSVVTQGKLRLCDSEDDLPETLSLHADGEDPNTVMLSSETLGVFRRLVMRVCEEAYLAPERTADLLMAAGEAALNSVVHGGGGAGCAYANKEDGSVQLWLMDAGSGIGEQFLHRATLEAGYSSAGSLGQGFPLMLRTADRVFLLTGETGTTVVLEMDRVAPDTAFLL